MTDARPSCPRHDPIACTPAPPAQANTQAARVARRVAFRESWAPTSDANIPEPKRQPSRWMPTTRWDI